MLRERHCAGVKPAVNYLRYPVHGLSAFRTGHGNRVNIRSVELYRLSLFIAAHLIQLFPAADGVQYVRTHTPRYLKEFPSNGYGKYPSPGHSPASHRSGPFRCSRGIQLMVLLFRIRSSFTAVILMNQDSLA